MSDLCNCKWDSVTSGPNHEPTCPAYRADPQSKDQRAFPVQTQHHGSVQAKVPEPVYMAAYEVYSHVHGPQAAMIDFDRGCRGGFGSGELVAFLYARAFPKEQWRHRVDEAFSGMEGLS